MACESCEERNESVATSPDRAQLKAVFSRFWPAGARFPPMAPYLGAAVSREEAWAWMLSQEDGARNLLTGNPSAVLHFIGLTLNGGGTYAHERKKWKRKPTTPTTTTTDPACTGAIVADYGECESWVRAHCTTTTTTPDGTTTTSTFGGCMPRNDGKVCASCG